MSRLYYSKTPRDLGEENVLTAAGQSEAANAADQAKEVLEKVAKLIPSEIIALYLSMAGFVPQIRFEGAKSWWYLGVFAFCWVLTPVYLNFMADKGKPKGTKIAISCLAFPVWAYSTSGSFVIPQFHDAAIASIVLLAFTAVTALLPVD